MPDIPYLDKVTARHMDWLTRKQAVIAGNVANASTPGYRAREIRDFQDTLNRTSLSMSVTDGRHMRPASATLGRAAVRDKRDSWDVSVTGNSVNLEQEMLSAGAASRQFSTTASVAKLFHRLSLMSARG